MTDFWTLFAIVAVLLLMGASAFIMGVSAVMIKFEAEAPDLAAEWARRRKARRAAK